MKKILVALMLLVSATFAAADFGSDFRANFEKMSAAEKVDAQENFMVIVDAATKAKLGSIADENISHATYSRTGSTMHTTYFIKNESVIMALADPGAALKIGASSAISSLCENDVIRGILFDLFDGKIEYIYANQSGKELFTIAIGRKDCK